MQWFNIFSILNSSDWGYWPSETTKQLVDSYGAWIDFFNLGSVNIQLTFNLFTLIWSVITNLGFSYDLATKITFLIPIAILGFIAPYVLFKKLTKNELIAFIIALFYGTTTHFLVRQTAHLPIAFVYALTPLILYLFSLALEKNKLVNWMIFVLIYFIGVCYEIRIAYIVTSILFLYFMLFYIYDIKKYWKNILLSIALFLGLNIFWLFPMLFGRLSGSISTIANRGLFGDVLFNLQSAFTLSESSWTGSLLNSQFIKQSVIWYFWILPIITFSVFIFNTKQSKYKKEIIFFGIVSLAGIFLTKQSAEPFTGAYLWLYNNFPGFNLFREASKFYLLTAIGYAGLIGYGLLTLKEGKNKILNRCIFSAFAMILISTSLWNMKPLITGDIRTMFISKHIPSDQLILKEFILMQPEYFRTIWVPRDSRWGIFTNQKPKISSVAMLNGGWKNLIDTGNKDEKLIQDNIINTFKLSFSNNLLDSSSVKYVIVPPQDVANDDDFFIYYGGDKNLDIRQWYISELDKINWLKKIDIGTKDLMIYENENYKEPIFSSSSLVNINSLKNIDKKYTFITNQLGKNFYFAIDDAKSSFNSAARVDSLFEGIEYEDLDVEAKSISYAVQGDINKKYQLYIKEGNADFRKNIFLNGALVAEGVVSLKDGENIFEYRDETLAFNDAIKNSSFEDGTWQENVGDCHNYDKDPILDMSLSAKQKSEGQQSLQLEATRHIACTSAKLLVNSESRYLFSFDYQSPNAKNASYYLGFNDPKKTVIKENLPIKNQDWQTFSKTITVPTGATSASLYVYARSVDEKTNIINRYDNFKMIETLDLRGAYYLVSEPETKLVEPRAITFDLVNPTKKRVHIQGATTPFYLAMSESFHPQWQLQLNNGKVNGLLASWAPCVRPDKVGEQFHYKLNDFLNGWYVEPEKLCQNNNTACIKNADGSYDIEMTLEFFPQRWFYLGLLISGTTLLVCLAYLLYIWKGSWLSQRLTTLTTLLKSTLPKGSL
ncbi:MAG: carbohydrate binding domain-containing protein [Parcubacteria group bacterium]